MKSRAQEFDLLIRQNMPKLKRAARHLARNNPSLAEETLSVGLEKSWKNFDKFESGTNFVAWFCTVMRNAFLSAGRRSWRMVSEAEGGVSELRADSRVNSESKTFQTEILNLLDRLNPAHRETLILIGLGGMTYEEVAEVLDLEVGTVKSRVSRARSSIYDAR